MDTIKKAFAQLRKQLKKAPIAAMNEAFTRIKRRTPVDTGRARESWVLDFGKRSEITSDLHYMEALEFGYSKQAPQGMLRITAREMPAIVKKAFKDAEK